MEQQSHAYTPGPQQPQGNGMAVAGLVLGIIGLLLCWIPFFGWILALLGIVFGALGMSKAKKIGGAGNGMAVAGLILGVVAMLAGIVVFVLAMMATRALENELERELHRSRDRYRGDLTVPYTTPAPMPTPAPEAG
jgi:small-conductance mechanosensitive channel